MKIKTKKNGNIVLTVSPAEAAVLAGGLMNVPWHIQDDEAQHHLVNLFSAIVGEGIPFAHLESKDDK